MKTSISQRLCLLLTAGALVSSTSQVLAAEPPPAAGDFRGVVASARDKVFPTVVYIKVMVESFDSGRKEIISAGGSGVLISEQGEILTNWHVIDKAVEVRCLLSDGRSYDAQVVGSDKDIDVALLQLELDEGAESLPYAELGGSSELVEGDFVMAMGAPWGMSRSVTIGIISCVDRYLPDTSEYSLWLQTDAAISPGNSGGPLVDTDGRVIGLNTRGVMMGGDLGFAVPADTIRELLPRLREKGQIPWTYTGIQLQPLRDFERDMYFDGDTGVIVAHVEQASPAEAAGLRPRDRLLAIDGNDVTGLTYEDLPAIRRMLGTLDEQTDTTLQIQRGSETQELTLTPRAKGDTQGKEKEFPRWDFAAKTINQFDNPSLFFHREKGVFISGVSSPGNAMKAGLRRDDILSKINGKDVESLDDLQTLHDEAMEGIDSKHRVLVEVLRNGLTRQIVLDFSRDYERD